jgi:hypothetical protein
VILRRTEERHHPDALLILDRSISAHGTQTKAKLIASYGSLRDSFPGQEYILDILSQGEAGDAMENLSGRRKRKNSPGAVVWGHDWAPHLYPECTEL